MQTFLYFIPNTKVTFLLNNQILLPNENWVYILLNILLWLCTHIYKLDYNIMLFGDLPFYLIDGIFSEWIDTQRCHFWRLYIILLYECTIICLYNFLLKTIQVILLSQIILNILLSLFYLYLFVLLSLKDLLEIGHSIRYNFFM